MMTVSDEKKFLGLSGKAIVSFLVSLLLCSILITTAIINRINVEKLRLEHLVLEKSLRINEVITNLFYGTQLPAAAIMHEYDEFQFDDAVVSIILNEAELALISGQGYSYELFKIRRDTGEKQKIAEEVISTSLNSRYIENHIQIQNSDWYLRVFPFRRWYNYPENMVLIVAGFFLSFIIFFIVQNNYELKHMRGVFENMARIDVLTGIYNRRHIEENLKRVINTISRSGGEISLLMIDVDFFKRFNDTYGHGKGDSCLKTVASALAQSLLREEDFVARYGGEEFAVVLPYCNDKGAHRVAERLLQSVRDCAIPHEKNDAAGCVTVSIGVTTGIAEHTRSGEEYLKKADEALYESKQSGRNKYTFVSFP